MVRVGREHFWVRNAAMEGEGLVDVLGKRRGGVEEGGERRRGGRTAYCGFFVFLKVVVDEAED